MDAPKNVRWAFDGSEAFDSSDLSIVSSPDTAASTLEFVNAQLVSHGFIRSPGLQLGSLPFTEQDLVAKCLMGMLRQRMNDISRSEELGTKLRTLTYEYERLNSIHQTNLNKTAQAESTAESAKAQKVAALKSLAASEQAHKQALSNLSKAQTALQYGRSTAQNEVKRKEKEIEKLMEKCTKICSEQARLGSIGAGLACANLVVVDGLKSPLEDSLLEQALADLEADKTRLLNENDAMRDVLLSCARGLQSLQHGFHPEDPEPSLLTASQLFTPELGTSLYDATAQAMNAHSKLRDYLSDLREQVERLHREVQQADLSKQLQQDADTERARKLAAGEVNIMKAEIERLKHELGQQSLGAARAPVPPNVMTASEIDEIRQGLSEKEQALLEERKKLSDASIDLAKEKEIIEIERAKLVEEKRRRQMHQRLSDAHDTLEAQREREIESSIVMPNSEVTRMHKVRRGHSIGSPDAAIDPPVERPTNHRAATEGEGKGAGITVAKDGASQPRIRRSALKNKVDPVRSVPSNRPEQSHPEVASSKSSNGTIADTSPERLSPGQRNPFDEVLLRSAQRPRPVFVEGSATPMFQPLVLPAPAHSKEPPSLGLNSSETRSPLKKSKARGKSSNLVSSAKSRTTSSLQPPVTPPKFTHRRIVGKRHQYAPAVPSPLSRILKMTADSSIENSAGGSLDSNSFSPADEPSQAGDVLSSLRLAGEAKNRNITLFSEAPYMSDDGDDGQWQLDEDTDLLTEEIPDRPHPIHPPSKNTEPLTENDLVIKPIRPSGDFKGKAISKPSSRSHTSQRQADASNQPSGIAVGPVRSLVPKGTSSRPREKENVPSLVRKSIRPIPGQNLAARKVVTGKTMIKQSATHVAPAATTENRNRKASSSNTLVR